VLQGEHICTEQQGIYTYSIFVAGSPSGRRWDWEIIKLSNISAPLVHAEVVAEGWARTRKKAVETAKALYKDVTQRSVTDAAIVLGHANGSQPTARGRRRRR